MTDPLEKAARAFRAALAEEEEAKRGLSEAKQRRTRAGEKVAALRTPLADEIVRAARADRKQADIARITGYNRERIRQICRQAGIKPPTD
ncbi:hypothetical protein ACIODS_11880 [Micromonospora chalcea]|uniref:hypothetical protein n=1 Tax=Micromonospora chalcea TaxID=1874 RepID=UPI00382DDF6F